MIETYKKSDFFVKILDILNSQIKIHSSFKKLNYKPSIDVFSEFHIIIDEYFKDNFKDNDTVVVDTKKIELFIIDEMSKFIKKLRKNALKSLE